MGRTQVGTGRIANFAIRRPCVSDHEPIREFLGGLSPRARYLRFFSGAPPTSGAMLRILAGGAAGTDVLVATGDDVIIGHAMAGDRTGPGGTLLTEIGVVVADAYRGQGVGSALVRQLVARASVRGATALVMEVLAENRQVLTMISDHWPVVSQERSGAYITFSARLEPEVPSWPGPEPVAEPLPDPGPGARSWPDPGSWLPGFGKETVAAAIATGRLTDSGGKLYAQAAGSCMIFRPGNKPGASPAAGRVPTARGARPDGSAVSVVPRPVAQQGPSSFHAPAGPGGGQALPGGRRPGNPAFV